MDRHRLVLDTAIARPGPTVVKTVEQDATRDAAGEGRADRHTLLHAEMAATPA